MGSVSELAAKKVGPTEDVIQALMETLVDPLLPLSVSKVSPKEDEQKSVAKQMHAVVLLYNYYHRKQKPELKFLDFVSLSKLCMVIKPPLICFMKLIMGSEPIKSNITENQLSLTEKAIKDACDIALALDASRDLPNIEGWPISKVAVLLIDSKKENCMLRFGDVTKGVWSLIEKELDESKINHLQEKNGDKRKRNGSKADICDFEFLQLGYDAVKDVTGIDSSDLEVLASHVTYSLSREKSVVRFYMMQCSGSFDVKEEASLEFLVDSLQGPLAEKMDYGFWKITTVVEFYHMLPYVEFISSWISGKNSCLRSSIERIAQSTVSICDKEVTQSTKMDSPVSKSDGDNNNDDKDVNSAKNKKSRVRPETSDTVGEKTVGDYNVIERVVNQKHDNANIHKEGLLSAGHSGEFKEMNTTVKLTNTCTKSEDTLKKKKISSKIREYHRRKNNSSTQNDACVREKGGSSKVNEDNNDNVTIWCGQTAKPNQLIEAEAKTKCNLQVQNVLAFEESQNALSLLYRKRQELYSQICNMEDTLAFFEDDITRIRDAGEVGLARECIKSILGGNYHTGQDNGEYEPEKKNKLSEIYVPGKSSCQDLEYICLKNNWRLPKYLTEPSDGGMFVSNVFVHGKVFELHEKGGVECKPYEARESAAGQMIAKLRNI